jgi:hypothetical protein
MTFCKENKTYYLDTNNPHDLPRAIAELKFGENYSEKYPRKHWFEFTEVAKKTEVAKGLVAIAV